MPEFDDIQNIKVKLEDGSVWECKADSDGYLDFIRQLEPPKESKSSPEPSSESTEPPESPMSKSLSELLAGMKDKEEKKDEPKPLSKSDIPEEAKKNMDDKVFRAKLQSVMLDNKYDRRLRGRSRGKLDMKALFKVPTQAKSVFTQKVARKNKEYSICILVDESGSMRSNDKCILAAELTCFLVKNFEGININTCIIGFNNNISILKEFGGKPDYTNMYSDISTRHHYNGDEENDDYDAMYRGYQVLKGVKGKKILLMLSDGKPDQGRSNYYDINGKEEDKSKIEKDMPKLDRGEKEQKEHLNALANANKDVVSIGIGIQEGGWQIPTNFMVKDLAMLKPKIIEILKKNIKRG
jgi:hypothetical protein